MPSWNGAREGDGRGGEGELAIEVSIVTFVVILAFEGVGGDIMLEEKLSCEVCLVGSDGGGAVPGFTPFVSKLWNRLGRAASYVGTVRRTLCKNTFKTALFLRIISH